MTVTDAQPSPTDLKQAADRLSTLESQLEGADVNTLATTFVRSGYFADTKALAQAAVKVIAGKELGIGAFAAMQGIYVVNGRTSYGANLIASLIQRSGRFRYRVTRIDNDGCTIVFYEDWGSVQGWVEIGTSTFGKEDAVLAKLEGKDTYRAFPRNMYFARALTNGARWFCPSVTNGEIFTPEEIGAAVDDDGNVIEVPNAPPHTHEEQKALADRYTAIHGTDEDEPFPLTPTLPRADLWAEHRRLEARATELGLKPKVLNSRATAEELAADNAALSERIDNLEMDQRLV